MVFVRYQGWLYLLYGWQWWIWIGYGGIFLEGFVEKWFVFLCFRCDHFCLQTWRIRVLICFVMCCRNLCRRESLEYELVTAVVIIKSRITRRLALRVFSSCAVVVPLVWHFQECLVVESHRGEGDSCAVLDPCPCHDLPVWPQIQTSFVHLFVPLPHVSGFPNRI